MVVYYALCFFKPQKGYPTLPGAGGGIGRGVPQHSTFLDFAHRAALSYE